MIERKITKDELYDAINRPDVVWPTQRGTEVRRAGEVHVVLDVQDDVVLTVARRVYDEHAGLAVA